MSEDLKKLAEELARNPQKARISDSAAKEILESPEAKELIRLLNRDGGALLQQAAEALRRGDMKSAAEAVAPVVSDKKGAELLSKLEKKAGGGKRE